MQPVEERAGIVDVLDHLARDDDVGRREPERAHRLDVAAVDDVGVVPALAVRRRRPSVVEVEADELAR